MKKIIAFAVIGNNNSKMKDWTEEIEVSSEDPAIAEQEVKDVVTYFNNTLKKGEHKRHFVKIEKIEVKEEDEPMILDDDFFMHDDTWDDEEDMYNDALDDDDNF